MSIVYCDLLTAKNIIPWSNENQKKDYGVNIVNMITTQLSDIFKLQ